MDYCENENLTASLTDEQAYETLEDVAPEEEEKFEDVALQGEVAPMRNSKGQIISNKGHGAKHSQTVRKEALSTSIQNDLLSMVRDNMPKLKRAMNQLEDEDPKAYAQIMVNLLKFGAPVLSAQTVDVSTESKITIEDKLAILMHVDSQGREV